jgi:hypothetical protein
MAHISLPPIDVLDAAAAALVAGTDDAARTRAINKAIYEFHHGLQIVASAGSYLVPSFREAGVIYRVSSAGHCSCRAGETGKPCKHVESVTILEEAGRYTMPTLARKPTYAEVMASVGEWFG